jgi:hypothetical protein
MDRDKHHRVGQAHAAGQDSTDWRTRGAPRRSRCSTRGWSYPRCPSRASCRPGSARAPPRRQSVPRACAGSACTRSAVSTRTRYERWCTHSDTQAGRPSRTDEGGTAPRRSRCSKRGRCNPCQRGASCRPDSLRAHESGPRACAGSARTRSVVNATEATRTTLHGRERHVGWTAKHTRTDTSHRQVNAGPHRAALGAPSANGAIHAAREECLAVRAKRERKQRPRVTLKCAQTLRAHGAQSVPRVWTRHERR